MLARVCLCGVTTSFAALGYGRYCASLVFVPNRLISCRPLLWWQLYGIYTVCNWLDEAGYVSALMEDASK
jgi:hypothetical protein